MEQTNLVVTPDGKTWDEVTRDTSYIGNHLVQGTIDANQDTANTTIILTEWRGMEFTSTPMMNKDFAIAYDRVICLVGGFYNITFNQFTNDSLNTWTYQRIKVNGNIQTYSIATDADWYSANVSCTVPLKRGDYVQIQGMAHVEEFVFSIQRI